MANSSALLTLLWIKQTQASDVAASKKTLRKLAEHEPMPSGREVFIAVNEQAFVPVLVSVLFGKERREEIDQSTIPDAELSPNRDLTAFTILMIELVRPGIHHERQWN